MKASELFVKSLENEGVEYIFGVPGEETLDLLESLSKSSIQFIITRHEQGAGFMAANYGRLTEKPGVCLTTLGPGLTNLVTTTAYAHLGSMPMLIISGQKPLKTKQGRFQIINAVNLMNPITKMSKQIIDPASIPALIRESFRIATDERPGPVHLELPEDIATMETNHNIFNIAKYIMPTASNACIEEASNMINASEKPLLLLGSSANRRKAERSLLKFVEKTGIPFFTTQMGKGAIDEHHSEYLGTTALSDHDLLHLAIKSSDLIINVGHEITEKPPFLMEHGKYLKRKIIHVSFTPSEVDEIYFPHFNVIGDIASSISQLTKLVQKQPHWDFSYFFAVKEKIETHLLHDTSEASFPMIPQRMVRIVQDAFPNDGIICLDNGMYKIWFSRNFKSSTPNNLLLDNALATMGAGLSAAISAKLIHPEKKVMAVCGDGGFMMNSQEMETAQRLKLDLIVLLVNDSAYGMIKWKQQATGFTDFGLNFGNPDFVKYAESYGAIGHEPKNDEEFISILKSCINTHGIHLINLQVDYSKNVSILNTIKEMKV